MIFGETKDKIKPSRKKVSLPKKPIQKYTKQIQTLIYSNENECQYMH